MTEEDKGTLVFGLEETIRLAKGEAVKYVLELHRETTCEEDCCGALPCCEECGPGMGWPCPTVEAVYRGLGKEN